MRSAAFFFAGLSAGMLPVNILLKLHSFAVFDVVATVVLLLVTQTILRNDGRRGFGKE